jgi:hypothetical protein
MTRNPVDSGNGRSQAEGAVRRRQRGDIRERHGTLHKGDSSSSHWVTRQIAHGASDDGRASGHFERLQQLNPQADAARSGRDPRGGRSPVIGILGLPSNHVVIDVLHDTGG